MSSFRTTAKRLTAALLTVAACGAVTTAGAEARVGDVKSIPSFNGTGTVALDGYYNGRVTWSLTGGDKCLYVQVKHVAVAGADSTWDRLTGNDCTYGSAQTVAWSKPTSRPFNGYKFRLCQAGRFFDSCGDSVTIYR